PAERRTAAAGRPVGPWARDRRCAARVQERSRDRPEEAAELAPSAPAGHIWRMFIQTEATPNPEVLKFLPGREVMGEGSRDFRDASEAALSPLAAELFDIEGVV